MIPAKALPSAKSRLLPATSDDASHRRLVEAIRADTTAAAARTDGVARVLLVVDRPGEHGPRGALVQSRPGLNGALTDAAEHAAAAWPGDGVAALVGDLPALRSADLAAALASAAGHPRAFVPDADGAGTTLLAAAPGAALDPMFGAGSAARHGVAAVRLDAAASLRTDVDTAGDLAAAAGLGLGPRTAAVASALGITLSAAVHLDVG